MITMENYDNLDDNEGGIEDMDVETARAKAKELLGKMGKLAHWLSTKDNEQGMTDNDIQYYNTSIGELSETLFESIICDCDADDEDKQDLMIIIDEVTVAMSRIEDRLSDSARTEWLDIFVNNKLALL